ncbi:MAG: hypothetical protein ACT4OI_08340 [Methanobacteriota archaeon]
MRPILIVVGAILALLGTGFALQGAYVIPATFMRGREWIAIGAAIAGGGLILVARGARASVPSRPA